MPNVFFNSRKFRIKVPDSRVIRYAVKDYSMLSEDIR